MTATTCTDCGADLHKAAEIAAGICVRCYDDDNFEAEMAEMENDPNDTEYRSCKSCGSGPFTLPWNAKTCHCCDPKKRAAREARERAAQATIYADATVAIEDEIDERDDRANERAEQEEWKEAREAEWAAEQGEEIIVETSDA